MFVLHEAPCWAYRPSNTHPGPARCCGRKCARATGPRNRNSRPLAQVLPFWGLFLHPHRDYHDSGCCPSLGSQGGFSACRALVSRLPWAASRIVMVLQEVKRQPLPEANGGGPDTPAPTHSCGVGARRLRIRPLRKAHGQDNDITAKTVRQWQVSNTITILDAALPSGAREGLSACRALVPRLPCPSLTRPLRRFPGQVRQVPAEGRRNYYDEGQSHTASGYGRQPGSSSGEEAGFQGPARGRSNRCHPAHARKLRLRPSADFTAPTPRHCAIRPVRTTGNGAPATRTTGLRGDYPGWKRSLADATCRENAIRKRTQAYVQLPANGEPRV